MNSKNSKTCDPHRLLPNLADKIYLRKDIYIYIYIFLYQILAFTIHGKIWKNHIRTTWNEEFELPDRSYHISDIQDYFEYVLKNMEKRLLILKYEYT